MDNISIKIDNNMFYGYKLLNKSKVCRGTTFISKRLKINENLQKGSNEIGVKNYIKEINRLIKRQKVIGGKLRFNDGRRQNSQLIMSN